MRPYTRHLGWFTIILAAALLLQAHPALSQAPAASQAKDPLIGTWLMDSSKSVLVPDVPMSSRTLTFTAQDNGFTCVMKTIQTGGFLGSETVRVKYTAQYDKDSPSTDPDMGLDTISLKKVDASTIVRTGKLHDQVVDTATMKLSKNLKVLTVTSKGTINGMDYSNTEVYNRQPDN